MVTDVFLQKRTIDIQFNEIIQEILCGEYSNEEDGEYLIHKDKRKVNLLNASSGQQEILPLLLILQTLLSIKGDIFGNKGIVLYLEEPEAHLYPNAQRNVIKLLARIFNSSNKNYQLFITTHSPYILSSFNNLIYAGLLNNKLNDSEKKKIFKIVSKDEIIEPSELSAYSISAKGQLKSVIDSETKLIAQNILDDVSNDISKEFGKLMDLES